MFISLVRRDSLPIFEREYVSILPGNDLVRWLLIPLWRKTWIMIIARCLIFQSRCGFPPEVNKSKVQRQISFTNSFPIHHESSLPLEKSGPSHLLWFKKACNNWLGNFLALLWARPPTSHRYCLFSWQPWSDPLPWSSSHPGFGRQKNIELLHIILSSGILYV